MSVFHARCVYCGGISCTCFDTDEEYEEALREEKAMTIDYNALVQACTGGETNPRMWRLTWLPILLSTIRDAGWPHPDDEDPTATLEMIREAQALSDGLTAALAPLAARQEEALREKKEARPGHELPF